MLHWSFTLVHEETCNNAAAVNQPAYFRDFQQRNVDMLTPESRTFRQYVGLLIGMDGHVTSPACFWRVKGFKNRSIVQILRLLSNSSPFIMNDRNEMSVEPEKLALHFQHSNV